MAFTRDDSASTEEEIIEELLWKLDTPPECDSSSSSTEWPESEAASSCSTTGFFANSNAALVAERKELKRLLLATRRKTEIFLSENTRLRDELNLPRIDLLTSWEAKQTQSYVMSGDSEVIKNQKLEEACDKLARLVRALWNENERLFLENETLRAMQAPLKQSRLRSTDGECAETRDRCLRQRRL